MLVKTPYTDICICNENYLLILETVRRPLFIGPISAEIFLMHRLFIWNNTMLYVAVIQKLYLANFLFQL
jgi:hypothetical protein